MEFEQGGETRAAYGKRLLADLADALTREFGRGFDERNLRNMRAFFLQFPIRNALRSELSWTHYRLLLRVDSAVARQWYLQEAASQNWSTRVLERQIGSLSYERLLSSQDKEPLSVCGSKDHSVVRYSILHESEQLFATKYRLVLPSEEELRQELERERAAIDQRLAQDT